MVKVMSPTIQTLDQIGESLPAARISPVIAGATSNSPNIQSSQLKSIPQSKPMILLLVPILSERRWGADIPALVLIVIIVVFMIVITIVVIRVVESCGLSYR